MPDGRRSAYSDRLAEELRQRTMMWAGPGGLLIISEYIQRARDEAVAEAIEAVRQVSVPLSSSSATCGWNNAVAESLLRLERLRADREEPPHDR